MQELEPKVQGGVIAGFYLVKDLPQTLHVTRTIFQLIQHYQPSQHPIHACINKGMHANIPNMTLAKLGHVLPLLKVI